MKPLFIAIEGLDGSGGTTQSRLLKEWLELNGHSVHLTREPSSGPVGKFIKSSLLANSNERSLGENIFPYLFAADRQDHLDTEIYRTSKRCFRLCILHLKVEEARRC